MNSKTKKRLNLSAKIIAVFYLVLITMFAFDESLFSIVFLIHLLPTVIFLSCLIVAWFKPCIGGILFSMAGVGTIIVFNTYKEFMPFFGISLVPILVGILFWLSKKQ